MRRLFPLLLTAVVGCTLSGQASAQTASGPRLELSFGGAMMGPTHFRPVAANEITPSGGGRPLFRTQSELAVAPALWTRGGVRVAPRLQIEVAATISRQSLVTRITNDSEAPGTELSSELTRLIIEGGVLADLARWRRGRLQPFAAAGAGMMRQMSDGRLLVETGRTYYAGGGFHYLIRRDSGRRIQSAGIRVDLRALVADGPLSLDGRAHVAPALGASLFIRF